MNKRYDRWVDGAGPGESPPKRWMAGAVDFAAARPVPVSLTPDISAKLREIVRAAEQFTAWHSMQEWQKPRPRLWLRVPRRARRWEQR